MKREEHIDSSHLADKEADTFHMELPELNEHGTKFNHDQQLMRGRVRTIMGTARAAERILDERLREIAARHAAEKARQARHEFWICVMAIFCALTALGMMLSVVFNYQP